MGSPKNRRWTSAAARRLMDAAGVSGVDVDRALDKIATKLLDGITCPPTDLDALLDRLNVSRVEADAEMMVTGALKKEEAGFVIQVFPGLSTGRRRFTIAHELGHAFMETTGPRAPRSGAELEEICDRFAAEILMPRRTFVESVGPSPDISTVLEVAREFRTSHAAAFRRVYDLYGMKCCEYEDGWFNWWFGFRSHERVHMRNMLGDADGAGGAECIALHFGSGYSTWWMEWRRLEGTPRLICLLARPDRARRRARGDSYLL